MLPAGIGARSTNEPRDISTVESLVEARIKSTYVVNDESEGGLMSPEVNRQLNPTLMKEMSPQTYPILEEEMDRCSRR